MEPRVTEAKIKADTDIAKCESCGSSMVFDPSDGRLRCIHCSCKKAIKISRSMRVPYSENDVFDFSATDSRSVTYRCEACGAVNVMNSYETAEKCPFCGVDNIVKLENLPIIKPTGILPFSVTMEKATALFKKWISKKLFAPNKFKKTFTVENVRGSYLPAWTFTTRAICSYDGKLGKYEEVKVRHGDEVRTERKLVWFHVNGSMARDHVDFMVEASKSIVQKELAKVSPYDVENTVGFNQDFLAGFSAERYDKEIDVAFKEAKSVFEKQFRSDIMRKYDADRCEYLNMSVRYENLAYRHLLLPMWIDVFTYKNKKYRILVNGRTGKLGGTVPKSPVKVGITAFVGAVAAVVIALLILGYI